MLRKPVATLFFALATFACAAYAAPVSGVVNITGSVGVSATAIDFFGDPLTGCSSSGLGTDGCFLVNVPSTGDFSTLSPGQPGGSIKDLQGPPISGPVSFPSFINFNNGIVFDLSLVVAGGAPDCATVNGNAANVSCTPVINGQLSPFVLTNSANGTNASVFFNVEGTAYQGSSATGFSQFVGAFNTPSAGKNIAGILSDIANGQSVAAAYSANFVATPGAEVPEPDTIVLLGLGLLGVAAGSLRKRQSSSR